MLIAFYYENALIFIFKSKSCSFEKLNRSRYRFQEFINSVDFFINNLFFKLFNLYILN